MRLNKYLSEAGICSRREADRLIEAGRVTINGKTAVPGMQVEEGASVCVDGKKAVPEEKKVLLLFYKPRGVECTANPQVKKNVISYVNYPIRVTYAGRLDKDSEGLLLLTNRGELIHQMMKAGNFHEKEYLVQVDKKITEDFLRNMAEGVPILGTVTRKCLVEKAGEDSFRIVLTQGLNRQIRRMCAYFGYEVLQLKRVRVLNLKLGDLKKGSFREATEEEVTQLEHLLKKGEKDKKQEKFSGKKPVKNAGKYRVPQEEQKKGKQRRLKKHGEK